MLTSDRLSAIHDCLWPKGFRRDIWMIVDAARDPRIFGMLLEFFYSRHFCLFSGVLSSQIKLAGPYLVQLEYDDEKTRTFINNAWGNSWGIFLKADIRVDALRPHLRGFLLVSDPKGKRLMFRYYDPRVLRVYLPTCNKDELRTVFGPIECFWTEDEEIESLLQFEPRQGELLTTKHKLS